MTPLTLEQQAGQILMPAIAGIGHDESSPVFQWAAKLVQENSVGGFVLFRTTAADAARLTAALQNLSRIPLFFAADLESGPGIHLAGAAIFPSNMAIAKSGNPALAREAARLTALAARKAGINFVFAPVADVNSNPLNPIICTRSYGETPEIVSAFAAQFVRGCQDAACIATAKHFPGHGDTEADSHTDLPVIKKSRAQLNATELPPFAAAITAGVRAIMTGHLAVPALDPSGAPATLSRKIVTDLLRKKMRFHGLVVTDALMMDALRGSDAKESRYSLHSSQMKDRDGRGLTRRSQDQILARAINAGCDILLMPEDPFFAHRKIVEMIKEGKIDRARIAESCARILAAKKWLTAKTPRIPTNLDAQCAAFARKTARAGILLDCEGARGLSPLRSAAEGVRRQGEVPILSGLREGSDARVRRTAGRPARRWGLTPNSPQACATLAPEILAILATPDRVLDFNPFAASLKCLAPSAAIRRISPAPSEKETAAILDAAEKNQTVILALYPVAAAWTDATRISPALKNLIAKIAERKNLIIISFGSPYIRREIPQAKNFICPFSDSPASQQAAAEILFR